MENLINVSIVTYKSDIKQLERALRSVQGSGMRTSVTIIDNSPEAKLGTFCRENGADYVFNGRNIGYGAAHNIAIRKTINEKVRYHLVLNPDIYFGKDTLRGLYDFMEKHPEAGLAAPKTLNPDATVQYLCKLLPDPGILFSRRFGLLKSRNFERAEYVYELRFTGYDRVLEVPYLSGSFMFFRVEALEKVGLFDEKILLYLEDTDITRRLWEYYKTFYCPFVSVYHDHGKESYRNYRALWLQIISAVVYFNKWGWFFDASRKRINAETLERAGIKNLKGVF